MRITTYGTRGSIPAAGPDFMKYGGNTTCLHIDSQCMPDHHWLVVDAGSGLMPLCRAGMASGVDQVSVVCTHYHYDHVQGLLLVPWTYMKHIKVNLYGPEEHKVGPQQMMNDIMRPPYHPISFGTVSSHFQSKGIKHPSTQVLVVHPRVGMKRFALEDLEKAEAQKGGGQLTFQDNTKRAVNECLVIRMYFSHHPERTISYRFEERPTGNVFVFLTDHENQDVTPQDLKRHLNNTDLLIMDSQYTRERYEEATAGFGHGTPDFCVRVAHEVQTRRLGLSHHDPNASDRQVDLILESAQAEATKLGFQGQVVACRDHQVFNLS